MVDTQDIILYTVEDIERIFQISRTKAYQLIGANGFPSLRINKRVYVPKNKLETWIDRYCGKEFQY